jgi:hypothetical protein
MKKLISSSEIVQSIHGDSGEWAVCAAAEADYDESDSRVVVELESFLRKASTSGDGDVRQLPWLSGKSRATEHTAGEEASRQRTIFSRVGCAKSLTPFHPSP